LTKKEKKMSIAKRLKSLNVAPDTMVALTYSEGTDCFMHTEDQIETAISNTDVLEKFSSLVATSGIHAQTRWGSDVLEVFREHELLDDYERGTHMFEDFIFEALSENYYDLELVEHSTEAYDYKRGFCTLSAEVLIPAAELISTDVYLGGWTASLSTEDGTLSFDI